MNPESVDVTAGLGGFLAFFLLAVALYFLMRNMNARLRRMAYRQEPEASSAEVSAVDEPPSVRKDSTEPTRSPRDGPELG
jgi:hypothetical protein